MVSALRGVGVRGIVSPGLALLALSFALGAGTAPAPLGGDGARGACAAVRMEGDGPTDTVVPGGTTLIGSDRHYPEERTPRRVAVRAFRMDTTEVTNAEFGRFVAASGYVTTAERSASAAVFAPGRGWRLDPAANWRHPDGAGSSIDGRAAEPVVQVSLEDALAYAQWRGRRLPSEAQWEHAARGGIDGREFAWTGELTPGGAHRANTWQGAFPVIDRGGDGYRGRAPVGCFPANDFGLYDLIGNVWEWTASPFYPTHQPDSAAHDHPQGIDPRQPGVAVNVIKGGSWLCAPTVCRRYRPAARHAQDRALSTNHIGFRTVLSLPDRTMLPASSHRPD